MFEADIDQVEHMLIIQWIVERLAVTPVFHQRQIESNGAKKTTASAQKCASHIARVSAVAHGTDLVPAGIPRQINTAPKHTQPGRVSDNSSTTFKTQNSWLMWDHNHLTKYSRTKGKYSSLLNGTGEKCWGIIIVWFLCSFRQFSRKGSLPDSVMLGMACAFQKWIIRERRFVTPTRNIGTVGEFAVVVFLLLLRVLRSMTVSIFCGLGVCHLWQGIWFFFQ